MAIDASKLTQSDRGRWVAYQYDTPTRRGRIKSWDSDRGLVEVVYKMNCQGDFEHYDQYEGQRTGAVNLIFIEPPQPELF